MRPMCPSCAPAPATTSCTRRGPLRCVPMRFDAPRPFSTRHCHPRCIPRALHMPQPQPRPHACALPLLNAPCPFSMHIALPPLQHIPRIPHMPWPLPTRVPAPQHVPCALHVPADGEWGRLFVWPVNSLAFHPVCVVRVCLCTVVTDPRTDTTRSHQRAGTGWCRSGTTRRRSGNSFPYAPAPN